MPGIRAAHLLSDLAPHLQRHVSQPHAAEALNAVADVHARRLYALLNQHVFTHRVTLHGAAHEANIPSDALAVVPQHRLTFLGRQTAENVEDILRLRGRLDASEIASAVLALEREFIANCERVLGSSLDVHVDAPQATLPPLKRVVASDMDGVLAVLRPQDPAKQGPLGFRDTRLGHAVQRNAEALELELRTKVGGEPEADDKDTEAGLLPHFVQKYGALMEEEWGEEAVGRIRQIFLESYPSDHAEQALHDAEHFISSMPMAYHVFRYKTWDHDVADVYDMDQRAADFAVQVIERGGTLLFVTAAPRIHAAKMLKASGVMDAVGPEGFELYTMEDMYEPGTVENRTFVEGDKGTLLANWAKKRGVPKEQIAMGGDQYHSDVAPVVAQGIQSRVVSGPAGLSRYLASVRLPRDEASPAQE